MKKVSKVLWALDAEMEDKQLIKKCAATIKNWTKNTEAEIEPVCVLSPDQIRVPTEVFANVKAITETSARKKLNALLKGMKLSGLKEPTLLASFNYSLSKAVQTLLDYARTSGAECLVISSQSKKGVSRFLFGSFAEAVITHAEIPILLVTPKMRPASNFKNLFFATDLSERSEQDFQQVLNLAEQKKLSLTIFNRLDFFPFYSVEAIGMTPVDQKVFDDDIARRKTLLNKLGARAKARGIKATVVLDEKASAKPLHEAILTATQKYKADLIAMSSKTGPVATVLLGSVTRQTLRHTTRPIWILHSPRQQGKF